MKIIRRKALDGTELREYVAETEEERRELQRRAEAGQLGVSGIDLERDEQDVLGVDDFEDAAPTSGRLETKFGRGRQ